MDLTDFLPLFSGVRKLFDPNVYGDPGMSDPGYQPPVQQGPNQPPSLQPSISQAVSGDAAGSGLDDQISQITKTLLDRLNTPDPNVTRLNDLYSNFPTREKPSFFRSLMGHALGSDIGSEAGNAIMNGDYNRKVGDWALKNKAAEAIANTDIKGEHDATSDAIRSFGTAVTNERNQNQATFDQQKSDLAFQKLTQDLDLTKQKLDIERSRADTYGKSVEGIQRENDLKLQAAALQHQLENEMNERRFNETVRQHNIEMANNANDKPFNMTDPNDPTKQILVRMNKATGKAERVQLEGQDISGARTISGGSGANNPQGLTNQTRVMMEGAKTILPSIGRVRQQAYELDKRDLFGPVMSRVTDIASKIGTIGDPGKVASTWEQFSQDIQNPKSGYNLNPSNDYAIGRFLTTLGLMTSNAARVHLGMRGAGSVNLMNQFKELLSSKADLNLFNGRLKALEEQMRDNAAGPAPAKGNEDPVNKLITDALEEARQKGNK